MRACAVELGFLPAGAVDGIFGGQTRAAVIAFQKWTGLARDDIPGPITQRELQFAKRPTPRTRRGGRAGRDPPRPPGPPLHPP